MNTENLINDIYSGIIKIAGYSYGNFLDSFGYNKKNYSKTTEFETLIYALFYFDYCIVNKNVSQEFRQEFYETCSDRIAHEFASEIENDNLIEIIDYRYNEYAQIPMKVGENWMQSFHSLYEIKLKGTKNTKIIEKLSGIMNEDVLEVAPKRMQFIKREIENSYKTAKLINDLLNGKNL